MNTCAVVLGGYVNGYEIIRDLSENDVTNIALLQYGKQPAGQSNKIKHNLIIERNCLSLKTALNTLKPVYDYLVLFPTDDLQLELLIEAEQEINKFCFLPFNPVNIRDCLDKYYQYQCCEKLGVPYPKTVKLDTISDLYSLENILFPVIIKPNTREDIITASKVFRSLTLGSATELEFHSSQLSELIAGGNKFLCSEIIPGSTDNTIFAYTAYRSKKGVILNEWTGRKLTQYPDDYGVFSSASNQAPDIILDQGRQLMNGMDIYGIAEPEFKYDYRDGKYKLTEINLRSMMWHRVGNLSGVNLQYTQWLDATGGNPKKQVQDRNINIHYCYLKHEIINRIFRKEYKKYFRRNLKGGDKNFLAIYERNDLRPFLYDLFSTLKAIITRALRRK